MDTESTQDSIRLDAWRSVFQKTNRILSEQKVTVSIVSSPPYGMEEVPAWSDGLDIFMSGPKVKEMLGQNDKMAAVLRLKGLNYHELCHVLYTPRMADELCQKLSRKVRETGDQTWWYAFNALEDQRIETWFVSTYGASKRYFEATILEWIIKNGGPESAVLVYGRKYLTPKIRVQLGRLFRKRYGQALYDEFRTVIDEYLTVVLPTDSIRAMRLIHNYVDLLKKMQAASGVPLPALVIADNGGDTCPVDRQQGVARAGRVYVKPAKEARDKAASAIEDAIDADIAEEAARDEAEMEQGQSGDSGQSGGKQGNEGAAEGSQSGDTGSVGAQGDQASEAEDGSTGASSTGTSDHTGDLAAEMRNLIDAAHEDLDEVRDDEWVQNDVENLMEAVKAVEHNGQMNAQGKAASGRTTTPDNGSRRVTRKIHDILSRIRQEAEPETLWHQTHGRLDARRWIQRRPHEVDVFKLWDKGNEEETGVEAVVLVDVSGSMRSQLPSAAAATWALKRAFDRLDIRTTVLLYDTSHEVLYQPGDKASNTGIPVLKPGGGTDPTSALHQTSQILSKSQAPNKVLITVTDGHWGGDEAVRLRVMKQLHRQGVVSMLLGLGGAQRQHGKHGHLEGHDIASLSELPKAATKLVAAIMRSATV